MKSRFDKLEGERPAVDAAEDEKRLDARFAADPEHGNRPDSGESNVASARLNRFDADGADGLGLDRDPLAKLPTLQCPACQNDCGKFETACSRCGVSLTDVAARAHNLLRAHSLAAERKQQQATTEQKRKEEIAEIEFNRIRAQETTAGLAADLRVKFEGDDRRSGAHWPWVFAAVVCFGLAKAVPWFGLRMFFVAAGTVCLLTRLPRSAWRALAKPARRW